MEKIFQQYVQVESPFGLHDQKKIYLKYSPKKSAAHKLENCENKFADQASETPGTPVLKLFLRLFWSISREKNHFKVNVRLRPSKWHINKNLQKIKSILYQDSCWINRTPCGNHLVVLQTPCKTDLETAAAVNTLDDWSWDCCCKHFGWLI